MAFFGKSLFFPPKNKRLARAISIETPNAFRNSIRRLMRNGLSLEEFRALNLAKTRARLALRRPNLSLSEERQMREISRVRIPKPSRRA